ncbi:MAG: hypothetical protein PVI72_01740, partial [Desulfobacterales bacterium]
LKGTTFKLHPNSLFEDGSGPGLDPVGREFQPSFETVRAGGGAYLFRLCQLSPLSRLSQFCQLKDIIDFNDQTLTALKPPMFPAS